MEYFTQFSIQEKVRDHFRNSLDNKRLAHAYLFYGPQGTGKDAFALELAKTLNCADEKIRPCNTCPSCLKTDHMNHPDVHFVIPVTQKMPPEKIRERLKKIANERIEKLLSGEEPLDLRQSREAASPIIESLMTGQDSVHIVNLPNQGQIGNLPREAVVETMGVVGANGAEGIAIGDLPPGVASILRRIVDVQELTVAAGLTGDRGLALQAMRLDPMVADWNGAEPMLDELLEANVALQKE